MKVLNIYLGFPSEVDDTYFPQLDVVGDIASNVDTLTALLSPQEDWEFGYYYLNVLLVLQQLLKSLQRHRKRYSIRAGKPYTSRP
jgi:hypothetical protein